MLVSGSGCAPDNTHFRSDLAIGPEFFEKDTLRWLEACEPTPPIKTNLARIHGTMKTLDGRAKRENVKTRGKIPILSAWPFNKLLTPGK